MVLGVNEYWDEEGADIHTDFSAFKKFIQRVMKNTGVDYRKWIYDITNNGNKYSTTRNKTDYKDLGLSDVYIFGHSLDISDKDLSWQMMNFAYDIWLNADVDLDLSRLADIIVEHWEEIQNDEIFENEIIEICLDI